MAGDAVRKDVLHILKQVHRGICVGILPREQDHHSAHVAQIQLLLPRQIELRDIHRQV
jgi:hypothetical protein